MNLPDIALHRLNPHYRAALVLIAAAVLLILVSILTDRRDLTSAALVIAALACLITGIFLATLSGPDPLDAAIFGLLPVQGSITITRVCAALGITGNAVFLPPSEERGGRILQFVPVSAYAGKADGIGGEPFPLPPGPSGLLAEPAGAPLMTELAGRHGLAIPADPSLAPDIIREVLVDLLEVADRATTTVSGTSVTIRAEGYRLAGGCRAMGRESPRCCIVSPCPVCSLLGTILVAIHGCAVQLERCSTDADESTVTFAFTLVK